MIRNTLTALTLLLFAVAAQATAPDVYQVKFETSAGDFVVEVHRDWAPLGADHFHDLVAAKYYDDCRFFRVIKGFIVQWGINGTPAVTAKWGNLPLKDDPPKQSNTAGMITYAKGGPNSRTTQVFINYADNSRLDAMGFAPFGKVISGMDVVEKLYAIYGESAPRGEGPEQDKLRTQGNPYLEGRFPRLDYIKKATILK